jgi:hypothetical protein
MAKSSSQSQLPLTLQGKEELGVLVYSFIPLSVWRWSAFRFLQPEYSGALSFHSSLVNHALKEFLRTLRSFLHPRRRNWTRRFSFPGSDLSGWRFERKIGGNREDSGLNGAEKARNGSWTLITPPSGATPRQRSHALGEFSVDWIILAETSGN